MADIDVVKKGSRVWLWVAIALVVVLALWLMMGRNTTSRVGWQLNEEGWPHAAALRTSRAAMVGVVDDHARSRANAANAS